MRRTRKKMKRMKEMWFDKAFKVWAWMVSLVAVLSWASTLVVLSAHAGEVKRQPASLIRHEKATSLSELTLVHPFGNFDDIKPEADPKSILTPGSLLTSESIFRGENLSLTFKASPVYSPVAWEIFRFPDLKP